MDKAKKIVLLISACVVGAAGALTASHQLSVGAEHWVALVGLAFGGIAHFLPSLTGDTAEPALAQSAADKAVQK